MLELLCWILFAFILVIELHPRVPTQNCLTKFGLFAVAVSAILLAAGKPAELGLIIGVILSLAGFSHRYILGARFDRRLR